MRNSYGTYLCELCKQPLKYDCLHTKKFCNGACRNKFRRLNVARGDTIKKMIEAHKIKIKGLRKELKQYTA